MGSETDREDDQGRGRVGSGILSSIVQFALGLNKCHVFVVVSCPLYFNFDVLYIACAPSLKQPVQVCILLSCKAVLAYSWLRLTVGLGFQWPELGVVVSAAIPKEKIASRSSCYASAGRRQLKRSATT